MHRTCFLICTFIVVFLCCVDSTFAQDEPIPSVTGGDEDSAIVDEGPTVHMVNGVPLSKHPTGAFIRSLVVPGWGQLYTDNWFKSAVFFGVGVGMWYGVYTQNDQYHHFQDLARRQKSETQRELMQKSADFYLDDRNRLIWWTAGLTLLSAFDAYVEAHLYDFEIDPTLGVTPSGDGPQIGISITLP